MGYGQPLARRASPGVFFRPRAGENPSLRLRVDGFGRSAVSGGLLGLRADEVADEVLVEVGAGYGEGERRVAGFSVWSCVFAAGAERLCVFECDGALAGHSDYVWRGVLALSGVISSGF